MVVTSIVRNRGRALGIVIALAMSATLVVTSAAFGAGDPVATGTFKLKLGGAFKGQLKHNGVKMKPKSPKLKVSGSSLDPVTGAGTLKLGKITFKKGNKKLVYGKVTATLGANGGKGNIKGNKGKLFSLKGGTVARNGFGADLSGVKVKFLKSAAKKINKKLGLHSLKQGSAGKVSASEQPQTVEVTGGTSSVVASIAAGSVISKLVAHCINPTPGAGGLSVIAPGTPNPTNPLADLFPVVGGTLSPTGTDGVVNQTGGVEFKKNITGPNGLGQTCPAGSQLLDQTDFAVNVGQNNLQAHVVIAGTGTSTDGDKGTVIASDLDRSGATVVADPTAHTITVSGTVIKLTAISATTLNALFAQPTPVDPTKEFAAGDVFGTASLTVNTR